MFGWGWARPPTFAAVSVLPGGVRFAFGWRGGLDGAMSTACFRSPQVSFGQGPKSAPPNCWSAPARKADVAAFTSRVRQGPISDIDYEKADNCGGAAYFNRFLGFAFGSFPAAICWLIVAASFASLSSLSRAMFFRMAIASFVASSMARALSSADKRKRLALASLEASSGLSLIQP